MICRTPSISIPNSVTSGQNRKKRFLSSADIEPSRVRREPPSSIPTDVTVDMTVGFQLDSVDTYLDMASVLPEYSAIKVGDTPEVTELTDIVNIKHGFGGIIVLLVSLSHYKHILSYLFFT